MHAYLFVYCTRHYSVRADAPHARTHAPTHRQTELEPRPTRLTFATVLSTAVSYYTIGKSPGLYVVCVQDTVITDDFYLFFVATSRRQ